MFRKPWNLNKDNALDLIMNEWDDIAVDGNGQEELNIDEQDTIPEDEYIENE